MLKGKKKALAAQVLLGLMVAGNAYAADRTDGDIPNPGVTINTAGHLAIIGNPSDVPSAERDMRALGADYVYDKVGWYLDGSMNLDAIVSPGFNGSTMSIAVGGGNVVAFGGTGVTGKTVNIGNIGDAQSFSSFTLSNSSVGGNTLNIYNIAGTCSQDSGYGKIMNDDGSYSYAAAGDVIGSSTVVYSSNGIGTISAGNDASDVMNIYNAGGNNTLKGARNLEFKAGKINVLGKDLTVGALVGDDINITGNNVTVGNYRSGDGDNVRNNNGQVEATGDVNIAGENFVATKVEATNSVNITGANALVKDSVKTDTLVISGDGSLRTNSLDGVNNIKLNNVTADTDVLVVEDGTDLSSYSIDLGDRTEKDSGALWVKSYGAAVSGNKIVSDVKTVGLREQTKSLVETQMASMALTNGSADLVASAGYTNAAQAVQDAKDSGDSGRSMVPYVAANYGSMRQESGSHVDVKGSNFNIGFAKEVKNGSGKLLFGPMFEYGRGNYDSYLDDGTTGSGTAQNYGIGMMARQTNDNGFYYEGSVRYGKVTSDYSSSNVWAGHDVSYDNSAKYWGAHVGVGKLQKLGGDNAIDLYGKLFYTNQGSSSVNINGDTLDFSSVKSKRSRIGFRYIHGTSDVRSVYAGLAWQYEFDGAAHATANGFSTPSPSVKGSSGMLELGVLIAPKASPVSFDLGVSGWAGKQKGYSLNANMLWSF